MYLFKIECTKSDAWNFVLCVSGCVWQGRACQLVVHHEEGFALYAAGTRGVGGNGASPGSPPTPLWRRPFEKLRMSADDGSRLLWLDFGGDDSEIVSYSYFSITKSLSKLCRLIYADFYR